MQMTSGSQVLGKAWDKYYQVVQEMRSAIEATPRFKTQPKERAQAYRCLMEAQAMAYTHMMAPRMDHPRVYSYTYFHPNVFTIGMPCVDCVYSLLELSGKHTYHVTTRLGDIKVALFQVQNHPLGHPDCKCIGNYDLSNFAANADGSIDIICSATKHEGNWIPLDPESNLNYFQIRRFFGDWFDDKGDIKIEMVGELEGYDESSEEAMAERIEAAANFVRFLIRDWIVFFYDFYIEKAGGKNKIYYVPGKELADIIGSPTNTYGLAVVECALGEAVIVEWDVPNTAYWDIQIGDIWCMALDNVFHQTDINMNRATIDSDGKFRCVITHNDPGIHNWLELIGGRIEFEIVMRNYREVGKPVAAPTLKKVKLSELKAHLPKDTPTITPEQRRKALELRHRGNVHVYDTVS